MRSYNVTVFNALFARSFVVTASNKADATAQARAWIKRGGLKGCSVLVTLDAYHAL